jgi:hypothetical protein
VRTPDVRHDRLSQNSALKHERTRSVLDSGVAVSIVAVGLVKRDWAIRA